MLIAAWAVCASPIEGPEDGLAPFIRNAGVEVFANHLRNLATFLYSDEYPPRKDDVLAVDFFATDADASEWLAQRGPLPASLEAAKRRADQELAHLTSKRISGISDEKNWDVVSLGSEIVTLLRGFAGSADPARLTPSLASVLPEPSRPTEK